MKIIIVYLITFLFLINNIIYCQTTTKLFANFLPFQNSECSGESYGIGLSISVGECINNIASIANIDNNQDLNWSLFINALRVGIKEFDNSFECSGNFSNFYSFKNSTCTITPPFLGYYENSPSIATIKGGLPLFQQYSKFFITKEPFYGLPNSITQVYSKYKNNKCSNNNNLIYSIFISNSLEILFNQTTKIKTTTTTTKSTSNISSILYQCNSSGGSSSNGDAIQDVCKFNQSCNNITLTTNCKDNNYNERIYCKIN